MEPWQGAVAGRRCGVCASGTVRGGAHAKNMASVDAKNLNLLRLVSGQLATSGASGVSSFPRPMPVCGARADRGTELCTDWAGTLDKCGQLLPTRPAIHA